MSRLQQSSKVVLSLLLVGVLSGYVWAAGRSDIQQNDTSTPGYSRIAGHEAVVSGSGVTLDRASKLIGSAVKGSDGKTLGRVHDIVLTPDLKEISYISLSRGGLFGIGQKLYAVPWSALQTGVDSKLYVPISKDQLLMKPGFKSAYWPVSAERAGWVSETTVAPMGSVAITMPTPAESRDVQHRRVSRLFGTNVDDRSGEKTGDIRDFIIERDTGRVTYNIVSLGGFWGLGSKYAAVPPDAIQMEPGRRVAVLTVNSDTLEANDFPPSQWPDLSSPSYAQRTDRLYNVQPSGTVLGYVPPQPQSNAAAETPARAVPSPDVPSTNAANLQTINGTVVDTMDLAGRGAGLQGFGIHLRTNQGNTVLVQLAPRDYLDSHNFNVAQGDRLTVIGKPIQVAGESSFQATRIEKDGQVLELRDNSGQALWSQPSSGQMSQTSEQMNQTPEISREPVEQGYKQPSGAM